MQQVTTVAIFGALAALAGCATVKPGLGFDEVQRGVLERTGLRVHWNGESSADHEATDAVALLLKEDLTADRAVQIALLSNHQLQAAYEELNVAQADIVQAGLLRNPIFSGEARIASGSGGTGVVLDVAQDFVSLFSMPLRKGLAGAAFEAAKVEVTNVVLDAAFEVRTAFYDYQAAEQAREMRATVLEATTVSYELAKRLRSAGNTRELDLANERALYEQSKMDLAAAEAEVASLRERMNSLLGLWGRQTAWRCAAQLPALPRDAAPSEGMERKAIEASLDLSLLRREAEIAARLAGIARPFAWLTDAEVGVAAEREVQGEWSVGPSVSLPLPLFDQGQATIAKAQARFRQVRERYFARAIEIRSSVRAAYQSSLSAFDRARYYEGVILPLAQRIVDATHLQYNAMQVSGFQLLQAKRDQINAGGEYISAMRDYWRAHATLQEILSGGMAPFETDNAMPKHYSKSISPFGNR